jgi:hypothetical protein
VYSNKVVSSDSNNNGNGHNNSPANAIEGSNEDEQ